MHNINECPHKYCETSMCMCVPPNEYYYFDRHGGYSYPVSCNPNEIEMGPLYK